MGVSEVERERQTALGSVFVQPSYVPPGRVRETVATAGWACVVLGLVTAVALGVLVCVAVILGPFVGLPWAIYDLVKGGDHLGLDIGLLLLLTPWWLSNVAAAVGGRWKRSAVVRITDVLGQGWVAACSAAERKLEPGREPRKR
jgi:hypothetical protein